MDTAVLALFAIADTIRDSSRAAVAELQALGVTPVLPTGDNLAPRTPSRSMPASRALRGDMLPQDKLDAIEVLRQR